MVNVQAAIMAMVLLMVLVLLLKTLQCQILNQILIAPNGTNQSVITVLKEHSSTAKVSVHLLVIIVIPGTN